jgi:predicted lipid-binding transport protein (Tim44 family)
MLSTVAIVLIVLWALGLIGGVAMGGFLHVLLVIAVIMLAMRFFTGRRVARAYAGSHERMARDHDRGSGHGGSVITGEKRPVPSVRSPCSQCP